MKEEEYFQQDSDEMSVFEEVSFEDLFLVSAVHSIMVHRT